MTSIRLLLVDDHGLFRESLARLLQADAALDVVGSYASFAEASQAIESGAVDVLLLDFDLGEQQALQALAALRVMHFQGKVLMVTAGMREADVARAIEAGIMGIFLKHNPPAELVEAIHRVARGEAWIDPRTMRALAAARNDAAPPLAFSDREREVLKGVFEGLTNKEIGVRMNISESYVKALMQQLFEKTGVRTRGQLVRVALEGRIA